MGIFTGTASATTELSLPTTPQIENITIAVAATEQSFVLPSGTKQFWMRTRGNGKLQYSYVATESTTKFITVPAGYTEEIRDVDLSSTTLYFQCNKAGEILELAIWKT